MQLFDPSIVSIILELDYEKSQLFNLHGYENKLHIYSSLLQTRLFQMNSFNLNKKRFYINALVWIPSLIIIFEIIQWFVLTIQCQFHINLTGLELN